MGMILSGDAKATFNQATLDIGVYTVENQKINTYICFT